MTDRDAHGRDFDEEWAGIVARLTDVDAEPGPPDGGSEDDGPSAATGADPAGSSPEGLAPEDGGGPAASGAAGGTGSGGAGSGGAGSGGAGSGGAGSGDAGSGDAGSGDGLARLFEPLRRAQPPQPAGPSPAGAPPPDAFVDNWADEGHFTPPPPPELPEGTPLTRLAWLGTLGGPATLLMIAVTGWDAPRVVTIAAGLSFLAGFATLVWGMPESREDGWDDGAKL